MTRRLAPLCLSLFALACGKDDPAPDRSDERDPYEPGDEFDDGEDGADGADDCIPGSLPATVNYLRGFTGAEDFDFDDEGYLVSIDEYGNLVGIRQSGETRMILPGATEFGAGTQFLPDGDLVFCDAARGSLVRVDPATGSSEVVLTGLEYPNGLAVDSQGAVYVAEQISGRVRRVDLDSGDYEFVAHGLYNPNGVSLSPDEETLYVGSFGGGTIWSVARQAEGWADAVVFATTPESPGVPPPFCRDATPGTECPMDGGYGLGSCVIDDLGDPRCVADLDTRACEGLELAADCSTERFGEPLAQRCTLDPLSEQAFCPRLDLPLALACEGRAEGARCEVEGSDGYCYRSFEGVMGCYLNDAWPDAYTADCADRSEGEGCELHDPLYPSLGVCTDATDYGIDGLACFPEGALQEVGGLDGLNVDECGNVYVTEFIQGEVWRFDGPGADAQRVATLNSSWIPNLHWGNGVGGWEADRLYVMDRDRGGVFELEVGIRSQEAVRE